MFANVMVPEGVAVRSTRAVVPLPPLLPSRAVPFHPVPFHRCFVAHNNISFCVVTVMLCCVAQGEAAEFLSASNTRFPVIMFYRSNRLLATVHRLNKPQIRELILRHVQGVPPPTSHPSNGGSTGTGTRATTHGSAGAGPVATPATASPPGGRRSTDKPQTVLKPVRVGVRGKRPSHRRALLAARSSRRQMSERSLQRIAEATSS